MHKWTSHFMHRVCVSALYCLQRFLEVTPTISGQWGKASFFTSSTGATWRIRRILFSDSFCRPMTEPRKSKILKIDFLTKMALVVVYLSYISRLKKNSCVKLLKTAIWNFKKRKSTGVQWQNHVSPISKICSAISPASRDQIFSKYHFA